MTCEKKQTEKSRVEIALKYITPELVPQARQVFGLYSPDIAERLATRMEYVLEGCQDTVILDYLMQPKVVGEMHTAKEQLSSEEFSKYLGNIFQTSQENLQRRNLRDVIDCARMSGINNLEVLTYLVGSK